MPEQATLTTTAKDRKSVLDEFVSCEQVRDSSRKTYRDCVTQFFNWADRTGRELSSIQEKDIIAFKDDMLRGHSTLTVRAYVIALRKFYAWAEKMGLYGNVASNVKTPKKKTSAGGERFIKMHLTAEEATELLEHFKGNPRNYAMMNLMLRTGLRSIEVSRARIQDITMRSGRRILKVWGKGMDSTDPNTFVVLTDAAWGPLRDYLDTRPGALQGEPLFMTEGKGSNPHREPDGTSSTLNHSGEALTTRRIQMIAKEGLRAIGLDGHEYSTHSLRHTTGTEMIRNGASILDVQRTLRHASVDTSMIYIASIQEEEHLRNAPEGLLDNAF